MPLVLGVDSSTSGCKVELRDAVSGGLVASGHAPHPPTTPPRSEQHPDDWAAAFDAACARAGVGDRHRPDAVSVAAQQHGLVVSDAGGGVLRPAKLWNDTESAADAGALVAALPGGRAAWAAACGSVPVASFTITKLRWLRRRHPDVFARVARVQLPHDWLTGRLTGGHTTDRGDASGTGWWSPAEGRYRTDLLALVDDAVAWDDVLPRVLGPAEPAGAWPASGDAVVGPGTGDNMAAALGLGLRPGDLAIGIGTSGTAYRVSDTPSADPTGAVAGFADATGRFLPLVCTLNATKVTDAVARLLGVAPPELDALALSCPPGARGLVLVPHLDGERTPDRPGATGTLAGLRSDVDRAQLARAAVEGVVCNLLDAADLLPPPPGGPGGAAGPSGTGTAPGRVLLVGGGARSAAFRQVVADLLGRPVEVPVDDQLVARGAAVQAAAVLAGRPPQDVAVSWPLATTVVEPRADVDAAAVRLAFRRAAAVG